MKVCCLQQKTPHFGAKRGAIWCKTHFNLMQNAVQFGAKRNAIWCKTQCVLLLNTGLNE